jgi:hypothetical protein
MENIRIDMCRVIKDKIFMKECYEFSGRYESSRAIALRDASITAR